MEAAVAARACDAGFIFGGIGSLGVTCLRLAGAAQPHVVEGPIEILTLADTIAPGESHLHMSVSDAQGRV